MRLPDERLSAIAAIAAVLLYCAFAIAWIPLIGPQQDEALFVRGLLPPLQLEAASHRHPSWGFMLMPYIGALKTWLYRPVFTAFPPNLWSFRLPAVAACALSVWLAFLLARRFLPAAFAAAAAWLLAADPMYLLTGTFDWGPVALQHLLALTMAWAVARLHETGRWQWAAAAGLACGLGVWDKVSFLWLLAGLIAAYAAAAGKQAWALWRRWPLPAAALAGAAAGSLVFLRYNLRYDLATFRASAGFEPAAIPAKLLGLWQTLNGWALYGFLVDGRGDSRLGVQGFLLIAALACIPFVRPYRRFALFAASAMAVSFILMVSMRNAGESSHHVILLWPLPQLIIAAAAAGLWQHSKPWKLLVGSLLAACLASGLLVNSRYFQIARNEGPGSQWTLASADLAKALLRHQPAAIFAIDWGILDPLRLQGQGKLPLLVASDTVTPELDHRLGDGRLKSLLDPRTLVVTHPDALLNFPQLNQRLDQWAAVNGLVRTPVEQIRDRRGVTQFEIFRYTPKAR